ncbi:LPXTG cell wall anchor domain-containing protein [Streptococcus ovuberis]|uniref:LPXTG cell wall anchor domain-containing protein n=1 Tax=Streptococcus ovuberis TaxID=1936207 RepID=A0A7X6S1H7_9STRE|nr:LPXTG cell wall anchor domain-containing protein [Streptococcus ovuberis]NKZ20191.1 LPXTG cell wall anchor domain-containing protein [Streptococcus ovuberis]
MNHKFLKLASAAVLTAVLATASGQAVYAQESATEPAVVTGEVSEAQTNYHHTLSVTATPDSDSTWVNVKTAFTNDAGRISAENRAINDYIQAEFAYVNVTTGESIDKSNGMIYFDKLHVTDRQHVSGDSSPWPDGIYEVRVNTKEPYTDASGNKHTYSGIGHFQITAGKVNGQSANKAESIITAQRVGTLDNPYQLNASLKEINDNTYDLVVDFANDGGKLPTSQLSPTIYGDPYIEVDVDYVHMPTNTIVEKNGILQKFNDSDLYYPIFTDKDKWLDGDYEARLYTRNPYVDINGMKHYYAGLVKFTLKNGRVVTTTLPEATSTDQGMTSAPQPAKPTPQTEPKVDVATPIEKPTTSDQPILAQKGDFSALVGTWKNALNQTAVITADGKVNFDGKTSGQLEYINYADGRQVFDFNVKTEQGLGFGLVYIPAGNTLHNATVLDDSDHSKERLIFGQGIPSPVKDHAMYRVLATDETKNPEVSTLPEKVQTIVGNGKVEVATKGQQASTDTSKEGKAPLGQEKEKSTPSASKNEQDTTTSSRPTLPKTGEQGSVVSTLLGAALALTSLGVFKRRRSTTL